MNQLFRRPVQCLVATNSAALPLRLSRAVTYEVKPTGEKVLISVNENKTAKKEKWQRVRPMGYEKELRRIKYIEYNERLQSDPKVARLVASTKLHSLEESLRSRGFCRETKPYSPPQNVDNIVENICRETLPQSRDKNWTDIVLTDRYIKYKFLTKCAKELNHEVPNSQLYLMKTVSDVLHFYSTPIRGISSYDEMVRNADQLPPNLHVIPEPILYNQESDTFFGGINAYPYSSYLIRGVKAKKKYPNFNKPFVWPDV